MKKPQVDIYESSKPADLGSCTHEIIADIVKENCNFMPDLEPYADKYGVLGELSDLKYLAFSAFEAWINIRDLLTNVVVEKYRKLKVSDKVGIHGTPDLVAKTQGVPYVLDWKSGRDNTIDYWPQLMGYLYLTVPKRPLARMADDEVVGVIAIGWLRFREIETREVTKAQLRNFRKAIFALPRQKDFSTGKHCTFCQYKNDCKARSLSVVAVTRTLTGKQPEDLPMTALADMYPQYLVAKDALENYYKTLKATISIEGAITNSKGERMTLDETVRQKIVPARALEVIEKYTELRDLVEVMTLPKGALLKHIGDTFPKGERGTRRSILLLELENAGAINETKAYSIRTEKQ